MPHAVSLRCLHAAAAVACAGLLSVAHAGLVPLLPDPCTSTVTPGAIQQALVPNVGSGIDIRWTAVSLPAKKLVVIVNGNSYHASDYADLADHLARNGFVAAIVARPNNGLGGDGQFVLDAIDASLDALGWAANDAGLKIALLGHSRGGKLVVDAAVQDAAAGAGGFPIASVVALAPLWDNTAQLDGAHVPSYLVIYGSQDEDLSGFAATVKEGFRAYDHAGTENSTTCNSPPCVATTPSFEKTMVYVRGADHAGLIGKAVHPGGQQLGLPQDTEYLAAPDQFCVVKAYTTGFLRWKLLGDGVFKGLLRGSWKPLSLLAIDTAAPDGFGHAAGRPLRLEFQTSPAQRKVVANFNAGLGSYTKSAGLQVQHQAAGTLSAAPFYLRHRTGVALLGWSGSQWIGWDVPAGSTVAETYSHFGMRVGQLEGAPAPWTNPADQDQSFWLVFEDGAGRVSWHVVDGVPPPDRYTQPPQRAKSAMHTVRVPVGAIAGIDRTDIRRVYLAFSQGTAGTLLVDSFEWHRD